MVTRAAQSDVSSTITIAPIETKTITVAVRGVRPIVLNRLAEKARQELLMPKGRKTTADKAASLKHDPLAEYRSSPHTLTNNDDPTLLAVPAGFFKAAMMSAALRLPGAKKTEIAQLVWVEGDLLPLYGIPELFMAVVRMADIGKTPDVKTRAIVRHWATEVTITFATPILNERSVINLLAAAGQICGVGDWRPEKGKGTFGQFMLIDPDDEEYQRIIKTGGRDQQINAMAYPEAYDSESAELFSWFESEAKVRGKTTQQKGEK